eukprot:TRINITY_DN5319_c0_g1_i5.p1 TRINITY_DN5319_c0_g1~~TRINITY_DN5319_c0_g1_i5.p1  ORF type:complete len:405 (+),score=91.60 TRINITY_DN5319_c0_g1_i5:415-1629(+)
MTELVREKKYEEALLNFDKFYLKVNPYMDLENSVDSQEKNKSKPGKKNAKLVADNKSLLMNYELWHKVLEAAFGLGYPKVVFQRFRTMKKFAMAQEEGNEKQQSESNIPSTFIINHPENLAKNATKEINTTSETTSANPTPNSILTQIPTPIPTSTEIPMPIPTNTTFTNPEPNSVPTQIPTPIPTSTQIQIPILTPKKTIKPSIETYNVMISGFIEIKRMEYIPAVVKDMISDKISANFLTFCLFAKMCWKIRQPEKALSILREMSVRGLTPKTPQEFETFQTVFAPIKRKFSRVEKVSEDEIFRKLVECEDFYSVKKGKKVLSTTDTRGGRSHKQSRKKIDEQSTEEKDITKMRRGGSRRGTTGDGGDGKGGGKARGTRRGVEDKNGVGHVMQSIRENAGGD